MVAARNLTASNEVRAIIQHNRDFISAMARALRCQYYVGCWHMNPHENSAMWRCYSKSPNSVAVRSTYRALRAALPTYVDSGVVRYIDYATQRLPRMNMFEYIMHKDIYYAFEQEVRAVAFPPTVNELGLADFISNCFKFKSTVGFRVFAPRVQLKELIRGIVVHPEASDAFVSRVRDLTVTNCLPDPTYSRQTRTPSF